MPHLCACGCGGVTPVAQRTNVAKGHVRGEHVNFCRGHRIGRAFSAFADLYSVDALTGCWEWTANLTGGGYAKFKRHGKSILAHRHSYELVFGAIPDGLEIDHLCRNKGCVNPAHLEAVTHSENLRRRAPFTRTRKVAT